MSLHKDPVTPAEHLARHLEDNYGLQLDPARHNALLIEIEGFLENVMSDSASIQDDPPVIDEGDTNAEG